MSRLLHLRSGLTVVVALATTVLVFAPDARAGAGCKGSHWVGAWGMSPAGARSEGFANQTLRMIVTPNHRGSRVRVRLTNRFGDRPVRFAHVHVALRQSGAELVPGSGRELTFRGSKAVTIKPGASTVSDRVNLRFAAFQDLAVSVYTAQATGPATEHPASLQTSFLSQRGKGDHAADESPQAFSSTTTTWFFVEAVEVLAPKRVGAIVALGDSITAGFQPRAFPYDRYPGGLDLNERYPDHLARRVLRERGQNGPSVLNAGINNNRILRSELTSRGGSALTRADLDVLATAGVTDVILLEGINDLGVFPRATPEAVIAGLKRLAGRLRGAGLNVLLGTLTPAGGNASLGYGSRQANANRERVNEWIRTSGLSVVDFDAAVRDPAVPSRLRPAYDSGDHLHPSSAGYRAMAAKVDLAELQGTRCGGRRRTALSMRVSRSRDTRPPYALRVRGRLRPAGGGPCPRALVRMRVASGRRVVASRSARVRPNCRFTASVVIPGRRAPGSGQRLLISARFNGSRALSPATARAVAEVD